MKYRITVTTEIEDVAKRFATAEDVQNELARFFIWNRAAFADKMTVTVEQVEDEEGAIKNEVYKNV
jgi:hypothetical protein